MLSREQIDFFHREGYLIMRGLIRGRELELLRAAADAVVAEGIAGGGSDHQYETLADGRANYRRSERMWSRGAIFQAVTVNPELLENIGQCIGDAFYPWNDSLVVKVPRTGSAVGWHQDPPYGDAVRTTVFPVPNFTTDIYLDRSGTDNGCVWAIPRHHLVGNVDRRGLSDEKLFAHPQAVPLEMQPGDVLFHCLSTPHGSRLNHSSSLRRVFYVHYLNEDAFADAYGVYEWSRRKHGWGEAKREQITGMLRCRDELGFASPLASPTLRYGEGGFAFTGTPTASARCWRELATAIPSEEFATKKRLQPSAMASAASGG